MKSPHRYAPLAFLFFVLWFSGAGGCTGSGPGDRGLVPAAPPAPLVELPSLLTFPKSLAISVDGLNSEEGGGPSALKAQVDLNFSEHILAAFITGNISGTFVDLQLASFNELFEAMAIPLDPTIDKIVVKNLRFSSETFVPPSSDPIENILPLLVQIAESEANGRFDPEGDVVGTVKVDFRDFDADNNGVNDGCTGCPCPADCSAITCPPFLKPEEIRPVCFQVWVDNTGTEVYQRLLAGRFDQLPVPATDSTPEIPGAGTFIQRYSFPTAPQIPPFGIRVFYDQKDLADRFNDFFIRGDDPFPKEFISTLLDSVHMTLRREGADEFTAKKTVKFAQECRPGREADCETQQPVGRQVSRFSDSGDLWSASADSMPIDPPSFTNECVDLNTALAVPRTECIEAGIDVEGEPFTDFVVDSDVQYPAGFKASPSDF